MWRYILAGTVFCILGLGGVPVLAGEVNPLGEALGTPITQVKQHPPQLSFEERLDIDPLTDVELDEITAAGVGPITYMLPSFLYSHSLSEPHVAFKQFSKTQQAVLQNSINVIRQTVGFNF